MVTAAFVTTLCVGTTAAQESVVLFCFLFLPLAATASGWKRLINLPPPTSIGFGGRGGWVEPCVSSYLPDTGTAGSSPPTCRRCRRWAGRSGADTGCWVAGRTRGSRTGRRWGCRSRTPSCDTSPGRPGCETQHETLDAQARGRARAGEAVRLNIHAGDKYCSKRRRRAPSSSPATVLKPYFTFIKCRLRLWANTHGRKICLLNTDGGAEVL